VKGKRKEYASLNTKGSEAEWNCSMRAKRNMAISRNSNTSRINVT
jgi:hypothetical protein